MCTVASSRELHLVTSRRRITTTEYLPSSAMEQRDDDYAVLRLPQPLMEMLRTRRITDDQRIALLEAQGTF